MPEVVRQLRRGQVNSGCKKCRRCRCIAHHYTYLEQIKGIKLIEEIDGVGALILNQDGE
jgi:hypothetical protein